MSFNVEEWISAAAPPQRTATVYGRADLYARIMELDQQAEAADQLPGGVQDLRLSGSPGDALRREADELREEMRASALTVTVRGLLGQEREALGEASKDEDDPEKKSGILYTYEALALCLLDPPMTVDQVRRMHKAIGEAQLATIVTAMEEAGREPVDVPLSRRPSADLSMQGS